MHQDLKYHKLVNRKFDAQGNVTDQGYYDTDGDRTKDNLGCHATGANYNKFGQVIEQRCYGWNAEAIDNDEEYHLQEIEYDDKAYPVASGLISIL